MNSTSSACASTRVYDMFVSVCVAVSDIRLLPAEGNVKVLEADALCGAACNV